MTFIKTRWNIFLLVVILLLQSVIIYSQQTSKDNYTGTWESPSSWDPIWSTPENINPGQDFIINGHITVNGSLYFFPSPSDLIINDTLVILGDLYLCELSNLTINSNGILIVRGNFCFETNTHIVTNNYFVITGNLFAYNIGTGSSFISNTNPVKVFVGGNMNPTPITRNQPDYPALNCQSPATIPYPDSKCCYGNMTDFMNDPLYSFFQTTCSIGIPTITASGPTSFCAGNSVTLTSSSGTSYLWSTGETKKSITVTSSGSYTVKITNAAGCQSIPSAATVVTVSPIPATPTITATGSTVFCEGGSVTLTSSPGFTYLWSNGANTPGINVTTSGSYSVRITNDAGCVSPESVAMVTTVNSLPSTPTISASGPTTFCAGGSVTLISSSASSNLWSNGEITQSINVNTTGSLTVRVTSPEGCQSLVSAPAVVNVNPLPVVNAGVDVTIPNGTSTRINATVNGTSPFTYSWSPSTQLVNALIEDPTTINLSATTIFTLTATSTATSCSNQDDVQISVSGGPLSTTPCAVPATVCSGTNIELNAITSGGSGTYTYSWTSIPTGFTSSVANPSVIPLVNTIYRVDVNDGFTTVTGQVSVTVYPLPPAPGITAGGPTIFCAGGSVNLTSSIGTTYLWSTGETSSSINATEPGNYWVQVTNSSGCRSPESQLVEIVVNPIPSTPAISASGSTVFCEGGSVTLTSGTGSSYLWSTGETTQSINVTASGSYTVQLANNGCQSAPSVPLIVTVNTLPPIPVIIADGPTTFCDGEDVILTTGIASSYLWSDGSVSSSIKVTNSGIFTVTVADPNGCQRASSAPVKVVVNSIPVVSITSSGESMCSNNIRTLSGSPAGGTFRITDGPGIISGNVLSATGPGTIELIYNYSNVCSKSDIQKIIVYDTPVANAGPDQELISLFEAQMKAELSSSETGEWSLISGSGNISDIHSPATRVTGLSLGENLFLWKVSNGNCEAKDEVIIDVIDIVTPTVITPNEDGLNDELIFPGLISLPGSKLIIYNRWGSEVYRSTDYKNDWKGKDDKKRDLEEDTYFYILKLSNGRIIKGFIEIRR